MHVSMRRRAAVPRSLVHRLTIQLAQQDPRVATTYHTARTRVVRRPAIVVAPPLRGSRWVVGNGCCEAVTAHRSAVQPINGGFFVAERFAIDFVQLDAQGKASRGTGNLVSRIPSTASMCCRRARAAWSAW